MSWGRMKLLLFSWASQCHCLAVYSCFSFLGFFAQSCKQRHSIFEIMVESKIKNRPPFCIFRGGVAGWFFSDTLPKTVVAANPSTSQQTLLGATASPRCRRPRRTWGSPAVVAKCRAVLARAGTRAQAGPGPPPPPASPSFRSVAGCTLLPGFPAKLQHMPTHTHTRPLLRFVAYGPCM